MASPDLDLDISPIPRSREENQERAFIAASRRKDRSLDARLESANRASMLHKKRTGKSLFITKDIVEKEAMYEEVDERYQEKRIRMLQAQNMQIEEQLHRQLLAAFAARSGPRRTASMTPRGSVDSGVRKMSLDLSSVRSSFSEGMQTGPLTSPMPMGNHQGYVLSPSATAYDPNPQSSYMSSMDTPSDSFSQIPSYVTQQQTTPTWQPMRPSWAGFQPPQQQAPTPFRDRMASAPEISTHGLPSVSYSPSPTSTATPAAATVTANPVQHTRVRSEPGNITTMLPPNFSMQSSGASSPKIEGFSTETLSTPELCPTPSTPHSPTSTAHDTGVLDLDNLGKEEGILFSHEELDPDFDEFSRFAFGLGNNAGQDREAFGGFDEFVTLDDFAAVA
ncbi:hypothetical protein ASPWEDRAFT_38290 [Aspergillus wentii DTO 134E9]|uniref:Uncharacterized protein n=1 Tax=Aspergillus wentii DTO 134E9 TaxID=1073089 RepID=A0A1L9RP25_ASPWE|nr:uncharacterized protein ASPWEDRAFT_38290 [Aspergillus wentii DTO 134E9]KAI9934179.1 hypothetical protein MW887_005252 [Aspergillus wentii]OJJ36681.1 hypothetical protein ASPWEDRAFT_38290 [Aspergillus wentii DTO 134E9]